MSAINDTWEYRTAFFHISEEESDSPKWDLGRKSEMTKTLDTWGVDGWEVISVLCPQPSNYTRFRVFAKRRTGCTQP